MIHAETVYSPPTPVPSSKYPPETCMVLSSTFPKMVTPDERPMLLETPIEYRPMGTAGNSQFTKPLVPSPTSDPVALDAW